MNIQPHYMDMEGNNKMTYSIITVVLNSKELLENTIQSVLKQSYRDFEYIIIDGQSTDGTLELIKSYQQKDARIRYISEKDSGIYNAMNKGIQMAQKEYMLFMGAGDIFYDDHILELVSHKVGADVVYGFGFFSSGKYKGKRIGGKMNKMEILLDHCIAHQATYVKTELMKEFGFNENYKIFADQDFLIHMYCDKRKFCYINAPLCFYDGNGVSGQEDNLKKYLDEHLIIMKTYFPELYYIRVFGRKIKKLVRGI